MDDLSVIINQKDIEYNVVFSQNIDQVLQNYFLNNSVRKSLFIIDKNFYDIYNQQINIIIDGLGSDYVIIESGEKYKTQESVFSIIDKMLEKNMTRNDCIIALGGGVIGDMVGFASSIFKRGVRLIQIPTTFLSMLDSSVGGKTGFDYKGIKNIIGSFYSSDLVIINDTYLATLPNNEVLSGYFEGIKHSLLIGKNDFNNFLESYKLIGNISSLNQLNELIRTNIGYKLQIVQSDPFELNGNRKILNYGHTFGHAIESLSQFKLPHGVCVGFGIIYSNLLSQYLGLLNEQDCEYINSRIKIDLEKFILPNLSFEDLNSLMLHDKKNDSENIKFILLKNYGEIVHKDLAKEELKIVFQIFLDYIGYEMN